MILRSFGGCDLKITMTNVWIKVTICMMRGIDVILIGLSGLPSQVLTRLASLIS